MNNTPFIHFFLDFFGICDIIESIKSERNPKSEASGLMQYAFVIVISNPVSITLYRGKV
jgi:hypothetical protein